MAQVVTTADHCMIAVKVGGQPIGGFPLPIDATILSRLCKLFALRKRHVVEVYERNTDIHYGDILSDDQFSMIWIGTVYAKILNRWDNAEIDDPKLAGDFANAIMCYLATGESITEWSVLILNFNADFTGCTTHGLQRKSYDPGEIEAPPDSWLLTAVTQHSILLG